MNTINPIQLKVKIESYVRCTHSYVPCHDNRYCNTIFCIFIAGVNSMILTIYVMSMSIVDSPSKTESDNELCYEDCTTIFLLIQKRWKQIVSGAR